MATRCDVPKSDGDVPGPAPLSADYLSILDALDLPIVLVRRDFTIGRFNRAATAALGLTPSDSGRSARQIGVLTDVVGVEERCAQVMADGVPCSCQVQNGDARFLLRMAPYATGDRRIEGAVLAFTNVTALHASIQLAIHEREYTKTILNTVIEPLVVLDPGLRVLTGNRAFYAMFEVSRDDAHGVRLCDLGDPDWDIARLQTLLNACFTNSEPAALETQHVFPALGPRTVLLNARRLSGEGKPGQSVLVAVQDITARKRAEAELRRTKENLSDFVENATIAMHWVGPEGIILWANRTELEMLGYAREEYVGHHIAEFHADAPMITDILERLTRGETLREYPARLRSKDGSIRHVLISSNVLWEEGKFVHTRCFTRDITERKRAEEGLKEADRRKDEFLATLAHELRNPLAPIRNSLAILELTGGLGPAAERIREMMERQVNHMVRLVDDLLEISRIRRGTIELRKERIELATMVRGAVEISTPFIEASRHQLAITLPSEPVTLDGDPVRLTQVIANLLNNAAKYNKQPGKIWLTAQRQGTDVVLSVRDTGIGISADMLPRVFEMFTQVDQSEARGQGGLGIGLALVENLVRMHGGSVEARSEGPARGSEFVVRLPLAAKALAPSQQEAERLHSATLAPRRILLVDDNRDVADSLATLLQFLGADVHLVNDGPSALESLSIFKPHVVLLDIGMPEMNGYEVARQIRQQHEFRGVPLVALTGWGQEEDRRRTTEAGFQHHLVKPVALDTLQALLLSLEGRGAELTRLPPSQG
jgi:two-component system, chemotaxis family, CheB/CheR fusion protein